VIWKETGPMFHAMQNFFLPPPNAYLAYNSAQVHNTALGFIIDFIVMTREVREGGRSNFKT